MINRLVGQKGQKLVLGKAWSAKRIGLFSLAALAIIAAVVWRGIARHADAANREVAPVTTVSAPLARARSEKLPVYLAGIGHVEAAQSVTVKTRVDGQLERVAFAEGQDVKSGDLLAQIDARPFRALFEAAQAQKARDEALLANARVDLKRYEALLATDSIQAQAVDTQRATVKQLEAAVMADTAQLDNARVQLDYTTIRSPISGRVGIRLVDAGNIVHATDATGLVVVNQINPIAVLFTLPESQFQAVNDAMRVAGNRSLAVEAYARDGGRALGTGRLVLINNQIDTASGTVQLKALFPNPDHRLWPGQFVNVHLVTDVRDVVTVPSTAILRGPAGLYVYRLDDGGRAVVQPVTVALTQDQRSVIATGLSAGVSVVADGQFRVKPGLQVTDSRPSGS